ncbi:MAG: protein kinase, partial [Myxococcota bacterium]|nr:protein kinase [Myxococcota bacterium]
MNEKPKDPDDTIRKFPAWASEDAIQPSSQSIPQIIKVLARGGMGTIYEAEQYLPQRRVAIKKIDDPSDLELQNSLMQEAMIMGALDHPNIIPVHR